MPDENLRSAGARKLSSMPGQSDKPPGEAAQRADAHRDAGRAGMGVTEDSSDAPRNGRSFANSDVLNLAGPSTLAKSGKIVPWYFCVRRRGPRD